ncbi:MAG: hypothetical protein R2813_09275 [Flavobacteriales bacterium]
MQHLKALLRPIKVEDLPVINSKRLKFGGFCIESFALAAAVMKADQRDLKSELNFVKSFD